MKLSRIEFHGYRRLRDTSCNVDGKVIAFIGPNEAGKSSVLTGLEWLTQAGDIPLPDKDANRYSPPGDNDAVVRARYRLEEEDREAVRALGLDLDADISDKTLTFLSFSRTRSGQLRKGIDPTILRNSKPFRVVSKSLESLRAILDATVQPLLTDGDETGFGALVDDVEQLQTDLDLENNEWPIERLNRIEASTKGLSNAAVAADLHLAVKTVEAHVTAIFTKLGLIPADREHRRVLAVLTFLRA